MHNSTFNSTAVVAYDPQTGTVLHVNRDLIFVDVERLAAETGLTIEQANNALCDDPALIENGLGKATVPWALDGIPQ